MTDILTRLSAPIDLSEVRQVYADAADEIRSLRRDPDTQFGQRLALLLECMLIDPNSYWNESASLLDEYKAAWEAINPSPPTFMGEPMPPDRKARFMAMRAKRAAINATTEQGEQA